MSPGFGKAGLLAHRAALVSCDTREKVRSGPEVVRKTFRIFDFSPVDGGGKGFVGSGVTCEVYMRIFIFLRFLVVRRVKFTLLDSFIATYLALQHFCGQFGLAAPPTGRRPLQQTMPRESLDHLGAHVSTAKPRPLLGPQASTVIA